MNFLKDNTPNNAEQTYHNILDELVDQFKQLNTKQLSKADAEATFSFMMAYNDEEDVRLHFRFLEMRGLLPLGFNLHKQRKENE